MMSSAWPSPALQNGATGRPDPQTPVLAAVTDYRRRLTWRAALAGALLLAVFAALVPLLVVAADHVMPGGLPAGVLTGALVVWAGGLALVPLVSLVLTVRHRLSPLFVAQRLERVAHIRHNTLINALLVLRDRRLSYAGDAALRQAARDVATHEPEPERRRTGLSPAAIALLATAAVWLVYLASAPKPVGPSLARFFGARVAAPTATRLELLRPRATDVVHAHEALTIEVGVAGRMPTNVRLVLLPAASTGAAEQTDVAALPASPAGSASVEREYVAPLMTDDHGAARATLTLPPFEVRTDLHYRLTAGDATLVGVIPVHPQPAIDQLRIFLEPPAYTGAPPRTVATPDVEVLAGTRATFSLLANVPLAEPVLVFRNGRETRARMEIAPAEPRLAAATLMLAESGMWHVEFGDAAGYAFRDPPEHRVDVRADDSPEVRITLPTEDDGSEFAAASVPELRAVATDDVGVRRLELVVRRQGREERQALGAALGGRACEVRFATADLALSKNELVTVWFEAADGRVLLDGRASPQIARSREITLANLPAGAYDPTRAATSPDGQAPRKPMKDAPPGEEAPPDPNAPSGDDAQTGAGAQGESQRPGADPSSNEGSGAAGDKSGEQPGDKGGDQPSNQPDDGAAADSGNADPNADTGNPRPDSHAAGGKEDPNAPAAPPPTDGAQGSGSGSQGDFDRKLDDFSKKHGREVSELARRMRESQGDRDSDAASQPSAGSDQPPPGGRERGAAPPSAADNPPPAESASQPAEPPAGAPPTTDVPPPAGAEQRPTHPPTESQPSAAQPDQPTAASQPDRPNPSEQPSQPDQPEQGDEPSQTPPSGSPTPESPPSAASQPAAQPEQPHPGEQPSDSPAGEDAQSDEKPQSGEQPQSGEKPQSDEGAPSDAGQSSSPPPPSEPPSSERSGDSAGGETPPAGSTDDAAGGDKSEANADGSADHSMGGDGQKGEADASSPTDTDAAAEVLDLLERMAGGEIISEGLLIDMGWTPERAAEFLAALDELARLAPPPTELGRLRRMYFDHPVGEAERAAGTGVARQMQRRAAPAESVPDTLRRITPPAEQQVPEDLQAILDAYYRSLAAHRSDARE